MEWQKNTKFQSSELKVHGPTITYHHGLLANTLHLKRKEVSATFLPTV